MPKTLITTLFEAHPPVVYQIIGSFLSNRDAFSFFTSQKRIAWSTHASLRYREHLARTYYQNLSPKRLHETVFQDGSLADMEGLEPLCIGPELPVMSLTKSSMDPLLQLEPRATKVITPLSLASASKNTKLIDRYITRIMGEIEPFLQIPHKEIDNTASLVDAGQSKNKQRVVRWLRALSILAYYQHEDKLIKIFEYYESLPKAKDSYAETIARDSLKYLIFCAASCGKLETIASYWKTLKEKLNALTFFTDDKAAAALIRFENLNKIQHSIIFYAFSYGNIRPEQLPTLVSILNIDLKTSFSANICVGLLRAFNSNDLKKSGQFSSFKEQLDSLWGMLPVEMQKYQIVNGLKATTENGDLALTQWVYGKLQAYYRHRYPNYQRPYITLPIVDYLDYLKMAVYFGHSELVDFYIQIMKNPETAITDDQLLASLLPDILLNAILGGQEALIEKYFGTDSNLDLYLFDTSDESLKDSLSTLFYNNQWDILQYLFQRISNKEQLLIKLNESLFKCLSFCAKKLQLIREEKSLEPENHYELEKDWLFETIEKLYDLCLKEGAIDFDRMKSVITQFRDNANASPLLTEGLNRLHEKIENMEQPQRSLANFRL